MPTEGYTVHQRLIPQEPAYVIFNVAMSNSFGYVDLQKLPFPSEMKVPLDLHCTMNSMCAASLCRPACFTADSSRRVPQCIHNDLCCFPAVWLTSNTFCILVLQVDYVRVYQDPAKLNIGCSPADHPTEQYLAWWACTWLCRLAAVQRPGLRALNL